METIECSQFRGLGMLKARPVFSGTNSPATHSFLFFGIDRANPITIWYTKSYRRISWEKFGSDGDQIVIGFALSNCVTGQPLYIWIINNAFLQRVSIASYAKRCISYYRFCLTDRLTVCLSVTRWYHAKTTPATIMRSSLKDSAMILVSSTLDFTAKFQREHRDGGRRMRVG